MKTNFAFANNFRSAVKLGFRAVPVCTPRVLVPPAPGDTQARPASLHIAGTRDGLATPDQLEGR